MTNDRAGGAGVSRRSALRMGVAAVTGGVAAVVAAGQGTATAATVAAPPVNNTAAKAAACAPRYLGYQAADRAKPFARFFTGKTSPIPARVAQALAAGPVDPKKPVLHTGLADEMARPGYSAVETGYCILPNGQAYVACLTDMPGVRAEMWDWWFGWHSSDSARYKLWHPDAHAFCALKEDTTDTPGLSDKERYVGNISYVDELIGTQMNQLAIAFQDPRKAGFSAAALTGTLIYARVGSSLFPVDLGWVSHQVRPTATGVEMRSRFFLNDPGVRTPDGKAIDCAVQRGATLPPSLPINLEFAKNLLEHCGAEMHHLSTFLPQIWAFYHQA